MNPHIIKNIIRLPFALGASLVGIPASIFFWAVIDDEGSKWPVDAGELRLIFWPPNDADEGRR